MHSGRSTVKRSWQLTDEPLLKEDPQYPLLAWRPCLRHEPPRKLAGWLVIRITSAGYFTTSTDQCADETFWCHYTVFYLWFQGAGLKRKKKKTIPLKSVFFFLLFIMTDGWKINGQIVAAKCIELPHFQSQVLFLSTELLFSDLTLTSSHLLNESVCQHMLDATPI